MFGKTAVQSYNIRMSEKPEKSKKLSTEPYKGVRDFYPADMAVQKYIFEKWKKTAESFGYEEYGASVLEPADMYRPNPAKRSSTSRHTLSPIAASARSRCGRR